LRAKATAMAVPISSVLLAPAIVINGRNASWEDSVLHSPA
jgi:hypothetical protein